MKNEITFILDGQRISLTGAQCNMTVLNYLRDYLNRNGTKEGCAEGDCGACTVVVIDIYEDELRYRSVNSCIQFMPSLDGKILYTVESLKSDRGQLHPVQKAMVECHGSQCGFCTPGFVMSLFALFKTNGHPTRQQISDAISGNLCRCTGYRPILDAGLQMYQYPMQDEWSDGANLPNGSARLREFEAAIKQTLLSLRAERQSKVFSEQGKTFHSPVTIDEFAQLYVENPDAIVLAGGTDIGLWVTKKHMDLNKIIYLGKVDELDYSRAKDGYLQIGAVTSLEKAFSDLVVYYPELQDLYMRFASLPIRNAGTLVGNLANGSPIGDAAPALSVLGASLVLRQGSENRTLPLDEFYLAYMSKDLSKGEFVEAVKIPLPGVMERNKHWLRVYKISKRFEQDISSVCAAFYARLEQNKIADIKICFGGMAATTKRAISTERALLGQSWNSASISQARKMLKQDYQPLSDMRASADYRMLLAENLLTKFYLETGEANLKIDVRAKPEQMEAG